MKTFAESSYKALTRHVVLLHKQTKIIAVGQKAIEEFWRRLKTPHHGVRIGKPE